MNNLPLHRSFVVFHLMLGIVVFVESLRTLVAALQGHGANPLGSHLAILAGIEAAAALLFLIPGTLRLGSVLLLAIFAFAVLVHGVQYELDLLIYAAGVLFVSVHGSAFSRDLLHNRKAAIS